MSTLYAVRYQTNVFLFDDREIADEAAALTHRIYLRDDAFDKCVTDVCLSGFAKATGISLPANEVAELKMTLSLTPELQKKLAAQAEKKAQRAIANAEKKLAKAQAELAQAQALKEAA